MRHGAVGSIPAASRTTVFTDNSWRCVNGERLGNRVMHAFLDLDEGLRSGDMVVLPWSRIGDRSRLILTTLVFVRCPPCHVCAVKVVERKQAVPLCFLVSLSNRSTFFFSKSHLILSKHQLTFNLGETLWDLNCAG